MRSHPADCFWPSGVAPAWLRREVDAFDAAERWRRGPEAARLRKTSARIGRAIAENAERDLFRMLSHAP